METGSSFKVLAILGTHSPVVPAKVVLADDFQTDTGKKNMLQPQA